MSSHPQLHGVSFAHFMVRSAMLLCPLLGVLAWVGWVWDVAALKSIVRGLPGMAPNTALALILGGVALGLLQQRVPASRVHGVMAKACAWGLILIGGLSNFQRFFAPGLGFQDLLFRWTDWASWTPPGLTAATTATCLVLLGVALLLLGSRTAYSSWCLDAPVALAMLIALFGINSNIHPSTMPLAF